MMTAAARIGPGAGDSGEAGSPMERLAREAGLGPGPARALARTLEGACAAGLADSEAGWRRLLGDLFTLLLDLDRALEQYRLADHLEGLERLHGLAVRLGRRPVLDRVEPHLAPSLRLGPEARREFLLRRALPSVTMGGDAGDGLWVDEQEIARIAAELQEPAGPLLARTARWMLAQGSRHLAKLYIFARLGDDAALAARLEPLFEAPARCPRAGLPGMLERHLRSAGARLLHTLQRGDHHDYNPLSASLWLAELGGRQVVIKEHLRLPVDFSRVDGHSDERGILEGLDHPLAARLEQVLELDLHELLVLSLAPGRALDQRTRDGDLLAPRQALAVCARVAGLLEHLHRRSLVYMDVKAANLVHHPPSGALALVDFGMARRLAPGQQAVTSLLSTAAYVPPEMALGFGAGPAADIFQLGLLACELLWGRQPFAPDTPLPSGDGDRQEELAAFALANLHCRPALDRFAARNPDLRRLLEALLDRRPEQRPDAAAAARALEELST